MEYRVAYVCLTVGGLGEVTEISGGLISSYNVNNFSDFIRWWQKLIWTALFNVDVQRYCCRDRRKVDIGDINEEDMAACIIAVCRRDTHRTVQPPCQEAFFRRI